MDKDKIQSELQYKAVRSSGAGGQNVNKVASKVELTFDLENSCCFSEEEKARLREKLVTRLNKSGQLILKSDEDRSQLKNKEIVTKRFFELVAKALHVPKIRKATKIPRSIVEKRLKTKRNASEIKKLRKRPL
ncbi:alternative ribosome rescue aminoacyl-tRNA hydrolase ArfB [Flavobacterium selenitireducens]|uniref:alternative ribosome rescue aminoacyl-tRNA hydrolase ArfB n=1 Tax=Flavobacterium selenitireducens TaxID=2722704 RepID=UPI00168B399F|nr:alternative ribosome rescue aminoacyl-tRNA hydrolase ArfB [Flavobacterium selenitireducens]MBD3582297.1 aminoacyl-tRNA hydrolase [Flavobacterium selenitireducens]